eukprot:m.272767 g.272767  ORF g.272767 m.272767 type:complete len:588 (+) comp19333_c0_seq15:1346-3109(+)
MEYRAPAIVAAKTGAQVTAVTFNTLRREFVTGTSDGCIKTWDEQTGSLSLRVPGGRPAAGTAGNASGGVAPPPQPAHRGPVIGLHFIPELKVLLSVGLDSSISVWTTNGKHLSTTKGSCAIHSSVWHNDGQRLWCGVGHAVQAFVFPRQFADLDVLNGGRLLQPSSSMRCADAHTANVCGLAAGGTRVWSVGLDGALCLYSVHEMGGRPSLRRASRRQAHDCGITSFVVEEQHGFLATASFDQTVKIWSLEGQLSHTIRCASICRGLAFDPLGRTLWIADSRKACAQIDVKSGEDVTEFVGTFTGSQLAALPSHSYRMTLLQYLPDPNEVVAATSRRTLMRWKHNAEAPLLSLAAHRAPLETVCYTAKTPLLYFTAGQGGHVVRWEQAQANAFAFSTDRFGCNASSPEFREVHDLGLGTLVSKEGGGTAFGVGQQQPPTVLTSLYDEKRDVLLLASDDAMVSLWGYENFEETPVTMFGSHDEPRGVLKYCQLLGSRADTVRQQVGVVWSSEAVCVFVATGKGCGPTSRAIFLPEHTAKLHGGVTAYCSILIGSCFFWDCAHLSTSHGQTKAFEPQRWRRGKRRRRRR